MIQFFQRTRQVIYYKPAFKYKKVDLDITVPWVPSYGQGIKELKDFEALGGIGGYGFSYIKKSIAQGENLYNETDDTINIEWDEDKIREVFPIKNLSEKLIRCRLSTAIKAFKEEFGSIACRKLYKLCVGLEYQVAMGLFTQSLVTDYLRPFCILSMVKGRERGDFLEVESSFEFFKFDIALSTSLIQYWVEGGNNYGLPDRQDFDYLKERVEEWVIDKKRDIRFLNYRDLYETAIRSIILGTGGPKESFSTWIRNPNNWARGGSSSVGHLELGWKDEHIRVKCLKSNVSFIFDFSELENLVYNSKNRVEEGAQLKIEPKAKARAFIADDLINYLLGAYLYGDYVYRNNDEQMVLSESIQKTYLRYIAMLELSRDNYCVSFDSSSFDKWPTKNELKIARDGMNLLLDKTYCERELDIFNSMQENFYIKIPDGRLVPHQIGILSGWFITNLIGTIVNKSLSLAAGWISDSIPKSSWFKGDDTANIFKNYQSAKLWLMAMIGEGIKAKTQIFGICKGRIEFLRQLVDVEESKIVGYPLRVGWWLSKDWNAPPPGPLDRLRSLGSTIKKILDRGFGKGLLKIINIESNYWANKNTTDKKWLTTPSALGGVGVFDFLWDGTVPVGKKGKKVQIVRDKQPYFNLESDISVEYINYQKERFKFLGVPDDEDIKRLINIKVTETVGTQHWPKEMLNERVEIIIPRVHKWKDINVDANKCANGIKDSIYLNIVNINNGIFPQQIRSRRKIDIGVLDDWKLMYPDFRIVEYLEIYDRPLYDRIKLNEDRGLTRTQAFDWAVRNDYYAPQVISEFQSALLEDAKANIYEKCVRKGSKNILAILARAWSLSLVLLKNTFKYSIQV